MATRITEGGWRRMLILFAGAAAVYAALVGGLYVFQRDLLYLPDRSRPTLGTAAAAGVREVTIVTEDGLRLLAWHLAPPAPDRPVFVYFHGNGGHIGYRAERAVKLAAEHNRHARLRGVKADRKVDWLARIS